MRRLVKYPTKLFTLMMVCFVGLCSLLLLVSGFVYYETYSNIAYREIRETKSELLGEKSQNLSNYVSAIQDTALFTVTNSLVQQTLGSPPDSLYDFVSKARELDDELKKLTVVKAGLESIELYTDWLKGYLEYPSTSLHTMAAAEAEGWLPRMDEADGFWIASHDRLEGGRSARVISYVHRISGDRGKLLGVVKINIPESQLFRILTRNDAGASIDDYYVIRDSRGNYIASMLPEGFETPIREGKSAHVVAGTHYSVIQTEENSEYWMLQQLIAKDVLVQSGNEIRMLIVGLLGGLILLSIPLAFWVSRRLTSPLHGMVQGMRAVERGDFNVRMNASNIQEYLYLTTHFNRMVHRLKELIGRLNQEHRDRREAEIQLLHAQIKPHFLYNTLDLIHWRALDYNAHEISQMVQQLSKLFRIGLSNDKWYVAVRDEMLHARCYMVIQEYRQNFNITYEEQVEGDLHDAIVPKIILQPFLENAVIHGNWQKGDKAIVKASFEQKDDGAGKQLFVTITDNGVGVPEGFDVTRTGGIGIRNVIDRIQLYCGPKYWVQVTPGDGGGTRVVIRLPIVRYEEEMEQLRRSLADEYDSIGG
ncbi:cache domain-containing sensor histidine kinase [Cohnella panacarvi]|uniref:cache domain-containing sensor histidine kinase n=1 Tax=Cohnella panacarvi TaxID=400776 RepID=UPI00047D4991|nr:sensor histidine kinase [Cohnella panacarvi]